MNTITIRLTQENLACITLLGITNLVIQDTTITKNKSSFNVCVNVLSVTDQVLNDNETAALILAKVIHKEVVSMGTVAGEQLDLDLKVEDIGVWIDPIGIVKEKGPLWCSMSLDRDST